MHINKDKLNNALADNGMSAREISSVGQTTIYRAMGGKSISTKSVGLIAKELGVKAADIAEPEHQNIM